VNSFVLLKDAAVVSLDVPIRKKIFDRMFATARAFERQFGREPEAFLLGPKEMLLFEAAVAFDKYAIYSSNTNRVTFIGKPVRLKMKPGIDLEIESRLAPMLIDARKSK